MSEPAPRKSYLIAVLVVLAVLAVLIAKTTTKREVAPQPDSQVAQAPAENPVTRTAAAVPSDSTKVGAPEPDLESRSPDTPVSSEPASPAASRKPAAAPSSAPSAADPEPEPPAQPAANPAAAKPSTPPEPEKKEAEPLPGSKLAESLKSGRPTMADFGAGWCKACKMMEPVLVKAATKYEGRANVVYVDTDKYPDLARSYRIASIPTQIFFNAKGEKVSQHIGYWPIEDVGKALAAAGVAE